MVDEALRRRIWNEMIAADTRCRYFSHWPREPKRSTASSGLLDCLDDAERMALAR